MYSCNLSKLQIYNWKFHLLLEMIMVKEKKNTRFSVQNDYFLKGYECHHVDGKLKKHMMDKQSYWQVGTNQKDIYLIFFKTFWQAAYYLSIYFTHTHTRVRASKPEIWLISPHAGQVVAEFLYEIFTVTFNV